MYAHQEVDKWAWELEQQLKRGEYANRGKLQRKILNLYNIRDAMYERKCKHMEDMMYSTLNIMKTCPERRIPRIPVRTKK